MIALTTVGPKPKLAASGRNSEQPIMYAEPIIKPAAHSLPAPVDLRKPIHGTGGESSVDSQAAYEPQDAPAVDTISSQSIEPSQTQVDPDWLGLRTWAELFNDAQLQRIAIANRLRHATLNANIYKPLLDSLEVTEHMARLAMKRYYRKVVPAPIREWQKTNAGLGESNIARLLGHLGHPVIAVPYWWDTKAPEGHVCDPLRCGKRHLIAGEPYERTIGQLWQYCGHGNPTARKAKGMTAEQLAAMGSPKLKTIVWDNAKRCSMQPDGNVYRDVYLQRRLATDERLHATTCVRCGPSGKPALEGSPWSKAHQHADALRIVGKEILRDLWSVAS